MAVFTKSALGNVTGTATADQILVVNPDDALTGTIDGGAGIDTLDIASGGSFTMGAGVTGIENVVLTGSSVSIFTTNDTAGLHITGNLFYDADGNGSAAALKIATLTGHPALAAGDIVAF